MTHKIELRGYKATLPGGRTDGLNLGTVNSYGVEQLQVVADGRWDGLAITATFHPPGGKEPVRVLVGPDGVVDVPPEATASASDTAPGKIVFAGVSEGVQRISCDLAYTVTTHAAVEGQETSATPDIWQQAIAQTTAARDEAVAASIGVKESAEAAAASAAEAAKSEAVSLDAATRAEQAAASAEADVSSIIDTRDEAVAAVGAAKTEALESVATAKASAVASVETAGEKAVGSVEAAESASVDSVNQAGRTAVDSIAESKTAALAAVSTAQTNAVEAVNSSKSSAVSAVQAAQSAAEAAVTETQGTAVEAVKTAQTSAEQAISTGKTDALEEISNAENYAVAAVVVQGNAQEERLQQIFPQPTEADEGKVPIVQDGKWILGETSNSYSKAESDARYAPIGAAICPTANGNPAVCENSVAWSFQGLRLYGKSTQDGTPSPESPVPIVSAGESGFIAVSVTDGAENSQQLSVSTPSGLLGLPVSSGGNYVDANGKQWVCDVVDFDSKTKTQNIAKILLKDIKYRYSSGSTYEGRVDASLSANGSTQVFKEAGMCTVFSYLRIYEGSGIYITGDTIVIGKSASSKFATTEDLIDMLSKTNAVLIYILENPIVTNLSEDEIAAYRALTTYDGTTSVSTTEPVSGIEVDYLVNGKKYASALESRLSVMEAVQAKFLEVDT